MVAERLTVEITPEQEEILRKHIPWGGKKIFFGAIVDRSCELLEKYGHSYAQLFVEGKISIEEMVKLVEKNKKE